MLGANIPAIIRGLIAVAWYGIQTYLASAALDIVLLKLFPGLAPYADVSQLRLPRAVAARLGQLRAAVGAAGGVFWRGMEIDPQVHRLLRARRLRRDVRARAATWSAKAGWSAIDLNLGERQATPGWASSR